MKPSLQTLEWSSQSTAFILYQDVSLCFVQFSFFLLWLLWMWRHFLCIDVADTAWLCLDLSSLNFKPHQIPTQSPFVLSYQGSTRVDVLAARSMLHLENRTWQLSGMWLISKLAWGKFRGSCGNVILHLSLWELVSCKEIQRERGTGTGTETETEWEGRDKHRVFPSSDRDRTFALIITVFDVPLIADRGPHAN